MAVLESTPIVRADLERIAAAGLSRSRMAGRVFRVTGAGAFWPSSRLTRCLFLSTYML